jgi:hypothetical protein
VESQFQVLIRSKRCCRHGCARIEDRNHVAHLRLALAA